MRTAIGYIRVSTDDQAANGVSLDAQSERIAAYCTAHGYELDAICQDVQSGRRADNRVGLRTALRRTCAARGVLVVVALDRLARNTSDAIEIADQIQRCRADLAVLDLRIDTTTPMGEFVFTLMAALGQMERRMIGDRTRAALGHMRREGRRISRHEPYGYEFLASGSLSPLPEEQRVLELIRSTRRNGASLRMIADDLNQAGIPPKRAKRWSPSSVQAILTRAARLAS